MKGWCDSSDPRRRPRDIQHMEAEDMKRDMDEHRQRKVSERQEITSDVRAHLTHKCRESETCPVDSKLF